MLLLEELDQFFKIKTELNSINRKYKQNLQYTKTLQQSLKNYNNQLYKYKLEYKKILDSRAIKFLFKVKKMIGRPYVPKYIDSDICSVVDMGNIAFNDTNVDEEKTYENSNINTAFLEEIMPELENIKTSNGCKFYEKVDINIAIVCDQFLFDAYKNAAHFLYLTPENWEEKFNKADLLLVASTWHGLNSEWQYLTNSNSNNSRILNDIIEAFNNANKKTIFYSKEDPVSFNEFLHIAQKCKYIFTSDSDCIEKYRIYCKDCVNVESLTFCIDPIYHNPINMKNDKENVIFSGSWMERFPERCMDQVLIFDGVIESKKDFTIVDRNYHLQNPRYVFPQKYHNYIVPNIAHDTLQKVHKLYSWAINLNSIKESNTMFANRAYELQAEGNLIISNYSVGMFNLLPYIFVAHSSRDVELILQSFSLEEIYERKIFGVRYVMSGNTCFDRLEFILRNIDIKNTIKNRSVCIVADIITDNVKKMFKQQTYKNKTLISIDEYNEKIHEKYDIIAFFRHDMEYEMFYIEDMVNAFKYTNCRYITKDAYYSGAILHKGKEHEYVSNMENKYKTIFWADEFKANFLKGLNEPTALNNGYSIDRFNYNSKFVLNPIHEEKKYKISVIIPTYNNGNFLFGKALASLKRSNMFDDIEIVIVDDGSTDEYTVNLIKYIQKRYSNIKTFFFNDGGSGSASRPRNKGVDISSANLIAFIDPDNEIFGDSYEKMHQVISNNNDLDFVSGNMLIMKEKSSDWNLYSAIVNRQDYCKVIIDNKYAELNGDTEILKHCNFSGIQIQSSIVKKEFLINYNLQQIEGAAGEDTLFGWQWVVNAKKFGMLNEEMSIYYAGRSDSIVNKVNTNFFKRYLKIEKPRRDFLEKENLLEIYMKNRFNGYFKGWTLYHLKLVSDEDIIQSIKYVVDIFNIYRDVYLGDDEIINLFIKMCDEGKYKKSILFLREKMH